MTRPTFRRLYPPAAPAEGEALWVLLSGADILVPAEGPAALLPGTTEAPAVAPVVDRLLLGTLGDTPVLAGALDPLAPPPEGYRAAGLRTILADADPETAALAVYAAQIVQWGRTARFCSACGQPLGSIAGTWGRACAACGHTVYPPVSPAVIVLVHDGERALLASKPGWGRRYSLVAGFVEPGETLEDCVAREVKEEVGVAVGELRYVGSQPWPFPHQIMIGFLAQYAGGEIAIDAAELADARWFTRDDLPELPPPFTISRQIIELWRGARTEDRGARTTD
ncbi:MAG TPA: NAD(+) diphosphatase [Roseiflexaceae bacterium]|nr:NAD(+) diphosphatase [Roseiflexaceae bacterium]